ncbi:GNAT family N-acetyltransferase [Microbacterium protaetiae]|uniref:GNAT family N-acetyltransferase n=1 Tax=Microbacterium protaetiae TaxID=2509458 RepID=A0A4P6EE49_9MICO|nr:GNAT family N-acetyltransferase [Microbacterium protaetiae]QAY60562.1 GNAT family N-acetyltransferase [Microbacterium protaetiae]
MTLTVRRATAADARAIATIRVTSWRVAYDGLIPDALLSRLDITTEAHRRAQDWTRYHADPRAVEFLALRGGRALGWASVGACRDDDPGAAVRGELFALYALPAHWSTGVGHALMVAAEQSLRASGFPTASLWVLDGNERAASFYERHGWHEDGTVKDDERIVGTTGIPALRERRRVRDLRAPTE